VEVVDEISGTVVGVADVYLNLWVVVCGVCAVQSRLVFGMGGLGVCGDYWNDGVCWWEFTRG
jgi:hypothetical protein